MRRMLAGHLPAVAAIIGLQLVQTTANLLLPTLNAAIIDQGIVAGDTPVIPRLGGAMAGIAALQVGAALAAGYLGAVVAMRLGRDLREELFATVQTLSSQEIAGFGASSLVTRSTNDVAQIQNLTLLVFTMLVAAPASFIGGVALALHQDVALSGIVVAVIPVLAGLMFLIVRRLIPLYRAGQQLIDRISRVLREQIIGANVIRGFVRQDHEMRRFEAANRELTRNNLDSALLVAGMNPMIMVVVNLSSVAVVWFGGHRIEAGQMRLGALTAFIAYILQILIAIMMAMYVFTTAPRAAACAERIQAVLDTEPAITDPAPAADPGAADVPAGFPVDPFPGGVEFRDV
ncbi:MAG TPA: ABC transporter permease, partial [Arthrobacter sp.]|nr:ABC transporter permease [Arthrobacter sp.]